MRLRWRWLVVASGLAVVVSLPAVIAALPTGHSDVSAATLLRAVQASGSVAYSGYAQSSGGLLLPVSSDFNSVADLFGGQTRMRVWWRGSRDWRVDTINVTGESDVHQNGADLWTWNYESNNAELVVEPAPPRARLPIAADLLPTTLARRLLSEAKPDEVSRLAVRRIAGRDAPGFRLTPHEPASTIDSVDVWVDPTSGAALGVDVRGAGITVVSSRFLDFSSAPPPPQDTAFTPPAGADVHQDDDFDIANLAQRLGGPAPPNTPRSLAGIARNPQLSAVGPVGIYGRGVTEFAAAPVYGRIADSLRSQLDSTRGVRRTGAGQSVAIGPLTLVLTPDLADVATIYGELGRAWLLVGTIKRATLVTAASELISRRG